jgi:hypothetical protein
MDGLNKFAKYRKMNKEIEKFVEELANKEEISVEELIIFQTIPIEYTKNKQWKVWYKFLKTYGDISKEEINELKEKEIIRLINQLTR